MVHVNIDKNMNSLRVKVYNDQRKQKIKMGENLKRITLKIKHF